MTDNPSHDSPDEINRLALGVIVGAHGLRGEFRMQIWTHFPEHIPEIRAVFLGDEEEPRSMRSARLTSKGTAILRVQGVSTREEADALRGTVVRIGLDQAAPLEEDEHYQFQLIGLEVFNESDTRLGTLTSIIETGANDVYVVTDDEDKETLLPALEHVILNIDLGAKRITVRPPDYAN